MLKTLRTFSPHKMIEKKKKSAVEKSEGSRTTTNLRVVSQQDETFHHVHRLSSHGEHFGHEVAVALEECDRPQLDVKEQSRHPGERLQVLLALVRRGRNQSLQALRLNGHLVHGKN